MTHPKDQARREREQKAKREQRAPDAGKKDGQTIIGHPFKGDPAHGCDDCGWPKANHE